MDKTCWNHSSNIIPKSRAAETRHPHRPRSVHTSVKWCHVFLPSTSSTCSYYFTVLPGSFSLQLRSNKFSRSLVYSHLTSLFLQQTRWRWFVQSVEEEAGGTSDPLDDCRPIERLRGDGSERTARLMWRFLLLLPRSSALGKENIHLWLIGSRMCLIGFQL